MEQGEAKKIDLQEKNSRILVLLPSLLRGLLRRRRFVERIYEIIDEALKREDDEKLSNLRKAIEEADREKKLRENFDVVVDPSKTIMLTYLFENTYTRALGMASNGNIRADVWSKEVLEEAELDEIVKKYFSGDSKAGTKPVFVRVYTKVTPSPVIGKEASFWLEIRRLLAEVGASIDLETKELEILEEAGAESEVVTPSGEAESVDPYNWFCSSDDFLKKMPKEEPKTPIEQVLEQYERNADNDLLFKFLLKRVPRMQHDPIPMCAELLAVLIAAYNFDSIEVNSCRISEPWEVLEAMTIH